MATPEELARQQIDALLRQCGWLIQDYKKLDLSAGKGVAIREVRLTRGRCDYLLLIDRRPVGRIAPRLLETKRRRQARCFAPIAYPAQIT